MSAPMAVGDVIEATFKATLGGQTILTVLHYRVTVAPGGGSAESELQDLANTMADPINSPFLQGYQLAVCPQLFINYVRCQKVKPARTIFRQADVNLPGLFDDTSRVTNIAMSIEKQTATLGRKGIGRCQIAGIPDGEIAAGKISGVYITGVFGGFNAGLTTPQKFTPTGAGRCVPCLPASNGTAAYDVISAVAYDTVRTMHRRTVGLGV